MGSLVFFSTQFVPVEEAEKFRAILQDGGFDFTGSEEGPLLDLVTAEAQAGKGTVDVVGALHGTFPPLQKVDAMANMADLADDLSANRELDRRLSRDRLAGHRGLPLLRALDAGHLHHGRTQGRLAVPAGRRRHQRADLATARRVVQGHLRQDRHGALRLPHAGLFHRFLEGYMWPSFTGGMVSDFQSNEAAAMLEWLRDDLWPYVNPQSINYSFMQEPLLAGEVWVAFDHTARLLDAFNQKPDDSWPSPRRRGQPAWASCRSSSASASPRPRRNPEAAKAAIDYLTTPEVQARILKELGFFPVVSGVDTSDLPAGVAIEAKAVSAQSSARQRAAGAAAGGPGRARR